MESTFYTAKEAAAFLEVTESEIYQLVVVKKKLRPILFVGQPPPPFKRLEFALSRPGRYPHDPFPAEFLGALMQKSENIPEDRQFVYVTPSSLIDEENGETCHVGEEHYASLCVDQSTGTLGPIKVEDEEGAPVPVQVVGLNTSMNNLRVSIVRNIYLTTTTEWVFTHIELEKLKYGKTCSSIKAVDQPRNRMVLLQRAELIVDELVDLGIKPTKLNYTRGKRGPKALVRERVLARYPVLFPDEKKFNDGWRYASDLELIAYKK